MAQANRLHKLKVVPSGERIVAATRRALRQQRWRTLVKTLVLNAGLASRLTWLEKHSNHLRRGEEDRTGPGRCSLDEAYAVAAEETAAADAQDVAREACIPLAPLVKWLSPRVKDGVLSQRNITADNFLATPGLLVAAEAAVERDGGVVAAMATEVAQRGLLQAALDVWLVARGVESSEMSEKLMQVLARLTTFYREKELNKLKEEIDLLVAKVERLDREASKAEIEHAFVVLFETGKENNLYSIGRNGHAEVRALMAEGIAKTKAEWERKRDHYGRAEARLVFLADFLTYAGEVERTLSEPLNDYRSARIALSAARRRVSGVDDARAALSQANQRRTSFVNELEAHVALKAEMAAAARLPASAVVPASADAARAALKL